MTISYRNGSLSDIAAIDRIFRFSFCDTFAHLYRDEDLQAFLSKFTPGAWTQEIANPDYAFRIAEKEGEAVGYAKLGPLVLPVEPAAPSLELRQLYLLKEWHGAGIGRALTDWVIEEARRREASELYLTVYTDNHRAQALYRHYGFEEVGPYAFMVGEQADEDIIMRLKL
ncbi:MAG TPA: GNAT family N-acetyltransferase [Sphingomicrobium sp.]|nr:GNAT family N-acetyltransferase [Sphingomicrobium sp.]